MNLVRFSPCALLLCFAGHAPAQPEAGWAETLSPQRIAELTPERDRLRAKLSELTRPALPDASAAEAASMRTIVESWNRRPQNGDGGVLRTKNRDELLDRFGLKAIDVLLKALESKSFWERRTAGQACRILVQREGDRVRDALFAGNAPRHMIAFLDDGPYAERVGVLLESHENLAALLQRNPLQEAFAAAQRRDFWSDDELALFTRRSRSGWTEAWEQAQRDWKDARTQRARQIAKLEAQLADVLRGVSPE